MNDSTETSTDLTLPDAASVASYFRSATGIEPIIAKIEADVRAVATTVDTADGRAEIKSLAYKVARSKTILDDAGKRLNEDAAAAIAVVNAERRKIVARLDALKEAVRKPLTDWEQAEEYRITRHQVWISHIVAAGNGFVGGELVHPVDALAYVVEIADSGTDFEEFANKAVDAVTEARAKLEVAIADRLAAEAEADRIAVERAELDALRAEKAARDEADRLAAADAARIEAEAQRAADIKAAEDRATAAALQKAADDAAEAEARHKAALLAADKAADDAVQAERARAAAAEKATADAVQVEKDRHAMAQRVLAEVNAKRRADVEHRARIRADIATSMNGFTNEMEARLIADAIMDGAIPHVRVDL